MLDRLAGRFWGWVERRHARRLAELANPTCSQCRTPVESGVRFCSDACRDEYDMTWAI